MAGEMEMLFYLAGRIYVLLRRETNRMIDVEWAIANADYALEVIGLARATGVPELVSLAERMEEAHLLLRHADKDETVAPDPKYVVSLR